MKKNIIYLVIMTFVMTISCKNEQNNERKQTVKENILDYTFDFPNTVYTHKKYKGRIDFYNKMLDSIAEPRRDTTNFRFIIYKPFKPYIEGNEFPLIYKDSFLLEKNSIDVELQFDEPGIYNIGGLARDAMRINYYSNGIRDSARFIEHEIVLFRKVIVRDSI